MKLIFIFLILCNHTLANYEFNLLKRENDKMYVTLKQEGKDLAFEDLKTVHENKLHVFVISEDLEFYAHVHPKEERNGVFSFQISNLINNKNYRVWGEFINKKNSKLNYVSFDITNGKTEQITSIENTDFNYNGLDFSLSFKSSPKAGMHSMGVITITKNGQAFNDLQTIMGEKAHLVGFVNSNKNIAHIHPMGFKDGKLSFHINFPEEGFAKLFVQFKIDDEEIIIPFGIHVN